MLGFQVSNARVFYLYFSHMGCRDLTRAQGVPYKSVRCSGVPYKGERCSLQGCKN